MGRDNEDRAQIHGLSDQLIPHLAKPPEGGPGTCPRCSTWTRACDTSVALVVTNPEQGNRIGDSRSASQEPSLCENCVEAREVLDREPLAVSVISLYRRPSRLRNVLTRYKCRRHDEDDAFDPQCLSVVRSMLGRYLLEHGDRLVELAGGVDGIVVVPSTEHHPPHPLEDLTDSLKLDLPRWSMLTRGPGVLGFRKPNRDGYRVAMTREPSRILLCDDIFTTGSRLNSAAAALSQEGHETVAALVLARRINTAYAPEALKLWKDATAEPFDWQVSPRTVAT